MKLINLKNLTGAWHDVNDDALATMYPTRVHRVTEWTLAEKLSHSTYYGVILDDTPGAEQFFCISGTDMGWFTEDAGFCSGVMFERLGFRGQSVTGIIEERGRLQYIDGCSDSMLVYPPRKGDPSLNLLYFPPHTVQTPHTHPSIRCGVVLSGRGYADFDFKRSKPKTTIPLTPGDVFYLPEQEAHRFITEGQEMRVAAYHPDGDWGPEDYAHPMLNRTYIKTDK